MGFTTGFVVIYNLRRRVIRNPVSVAEFYVRYGTFWPDILASLPTIAEASLSHAPSSLDLNQKWAQETALTRAVSTCIEDRPCQSLPAALR